jgi:hypothetical protein
MHAREEERCAAHPGVLGDEKEGRRGSPALWKEKWPGVDEAEVDELELLRASPAP